VPLNAVNLALSMINELSFSVADLMSGWTALSRLDTPVDIAEESTTVKSNRVRPNLSGFSADVPGKVASTPA
jgi:hypothetical protein